MPMLSQTNSYFIEQDSGEFLIELLEKLDKEFKILEVIELPSKIFNIDSVEAIKCPSCQKESKQKAVYLSLDIPLHQFIQSKTAEKSSNTPVSQQSHNSTLENGEGTKQVTLVDILQDTCEEEISSYKCSECDKNVNGLKTIFLSSLPAVLVFTLKRFYYDHKLEQTSYNDIHESYPFS